MTTVASADFRKAMAHFATGVAVVTATGEDGGQGATISALSSVSLDPLTLLICLNRNSATCRAIEQSGTFGLSILSSTQQDIALHFARPAHDKLARDKLARDKLARDKLTGDQSAADYGVRHQDGTLFIREALVQIGVEVVETLRGGTHEIFLARPLHITLNSDPDAGPLLYFRGAFSLTP